MFQNKVKFFLFVIVVLVVIAAGILVGKLKDGETVNKMYERQDFTLLDDGGELFRLSSFAKDKKILLLFTPDGLPVKDVVPFHAFTKTLSRLQKMNVEVMLITRTNREIVRNFKSAAKFPGKILLDPSGTVGKLLGFWPTPSPVEYWSYALIDSSFKGYWLSTTKELYGVEEILRHLPSSANSSKTTSSASP